MKINRFLATMSFLMVAVLVQSCAGGGGDSPPPPVPVVTAINSGIAGSGTVNSLFVLEGSGFGTITAATAGYSVDFKDATTGAVVASATVNYATDWTDAFIKATVPTTGLTAGTTYKVTVTTPGGTSTAVDFLVVASVAFSPSTIAWAPSAALPVAMQGFPTVTASFTNVSSISRTYMYTFGGNTATTTSASGKTLNVSTVNHSLLNTAPTSGTNTPGPTTWAATTALPEVRGFSAAIFANKYNSKFSGKPYGSVYVIGGLDASGAATATVYQAAVNANGTLAAWSTLTTTPLPQALYAHSAVIVRNRVYVAGGNDASGNPVKTVYSASISSDGTLGAWAQLGDLPEARAYHNLISVAGYMYVIGGVNAPDDPISNTLSAATVGTIHSAQISLLDGSLVVPAGAASPWAATTSLGKNREKFTATVVGSNILVSGGLYNGDSSGSSEQSYSTINSDGTLGPFGGATGSNTISGTAGGYNFYNHANAYFVDTNSMPHVVVLGGTDVNSGTPHNGVWVMK